MWLIHISSDKPATCYSYYSLHCLSFYISIPIFWVWFMFQLFWFKSFSLLVQKACLNNELVEFDSVVVLFEMNGCVLIDWANVWIECIGIIRCLFWSSLQSLEENEHVIESMTGNVSVSDWLWRNALTVSRWECDP